MIRLTIFIIALLLAVGAVEPTQPLLITMAVLAGLSLVRVRLPGLRSRGWRRDPWFEYDYK